MLYFILEVKIMKSERAGKYMTYLQGEIAYKAFKPALLPPHPPVTIDEEMAFLLRTAHRMLGKLEGISEQIPDIDLFIAMYVRKESLLSSQIEGTQATLDDILDPDIEDNTNLDVADVINYIKTMQFALDRLKELPLCNRLLKEMHEMLMEGVRGQERNPGEFRRSQNWIGPQGGSLKNAVFVPPTKEVMEEVMSDLEKFMHEEDYSDPLLKIGLIHYQFETTHPFLDGNGRIGRMLITLWLMLQGLLKGPVLYISYYFKRNRMEYYDRLMDVRLKGHIEEWIRFFLKGIIASAEDACKTIEVMNQIKIEAIKKIETFKGRKETLYKIYHYVVRNPIIEIGKTAEVLDLSFNAVAKAVNKLVELDILEQVNSYKRNRRFAFSKYLNVLKKDT